MNLADKVLSHKADILDKWEKRVRKEVYAAEEASRAALMNLMPVFLERIAVTLRLGGGDPCTMDDVCRQHGEERAFLQSYTLSQVIDEYAILREIIFETLNQDGDVLPAKERDIVWGAILSAISAAGTEFARLQLAMTESALEDSRNALSRIEEERRLREQFVVTLAHDLRQPLTAARASAQLMLRHASNVELSSRMAAKTIEGIDHTVEMIHDLLNANRIWFGRNLPLNLSECDLKGLVEDVLQELATIYGERFVMHSPDTVFGSWDCRLLRRAIANLVVNAVKYGDGKADVQITIRDTQDQAAIAVHNEGNPIDPIDQRRIFEPYYRVLNAEKTGEKGWGLGLTLVKGISAAHGGSVLLESSPQHGTTFTIKIPKRPPQRDVT